MNNVDLQDIRTAKNFQEAYELFKVIPNVERKNNVYNTLINKAKTLEEASVLLEDMKRSNVRINDKIFRGFLLRTKNDSEVLTLLKMVDYKHYKLNKTTYRELLQKIRNYKTAQNILNHIKKLTVPSLDMYQVIIHKTRNFSEVVPYLNELKELNIALDERTCSTVVNKVENFSDAILFVYDMLDQNIKVRQKVYSNLIALTLNENQLEELLTLLKNQDALSLLDEEIIKQLQDKKEEIKVQPKDRNKKGERLEEANKSLNNAENPILQKVSDETLRERYDFLNGNQTSESSFHIIDSNEPLQDHINFLANEIDVVNMYLATGFLYKSGLELISSTVEKVAKNTGQIEMVVGSLQKYNHISQSDTRKIHSMDKGTAKYLNEWIKINSAVLKTIEKRFYHGKFYLFEGEEKSVVLIGSSNISSSGFMSNHELNLLYILDSESSLFRKFKGEFRIISKKSVVINNLEPNKFMEMTTEHDHFSNISSIKKLQSTQVREKIEALSEEQVKKRLKMWMQRSPTNVYSELGIISLKDYILFEYKEYDLLVLESFEAGNAYYYFKNIELEDLMKTIKPLSKTDIFDMSNMQKRGYHIKNESTLELAISSLFIKRFASSNIR